MSTIDVHAALSSVAQDELARRRLADFIRLLEPSYEQTRHTRALCDHLEAVERGEIDRLIIQMPPRHGKTLHVSQALPAWVFGRNPRAQIILASYGAELAEENSRKARSFVRSDVWPFECRVSEESRAQNRWHTDAGGILIATGCEGAVTGRGANYLIIDDPIRDRAEADSELIRKRLWDWWTDVARTRLMPKARVILASTRWHFDDLTGRILNTEDGKRWTVLSLPAIAEQGDVLGRKPGEALWPEWFPIDALPSVERGEMSSRSFEALFQQRPSSEQGGLFKRLWFENHFDGPLPVIMDRITQKAGTPFEEIIERPRRFEVIGAIDCASKTTLNADFSVIAIVATDGRDFYCLDIVRHRCEFPELVAMTIETFRKWSPSRLYIEDTSNGTPLIQELRRSSALPVIPVTVKGSKVARAEATTAWFESSRVKFPSGAPWLSDLVDEYGTFPLGRHDDQVDALTMALRLSCTLAESNMRAEAAASQFHDWMDR